ncbi:hypothetical protein T484DRAFT_1770046 [Baffinella frigidus]|nr:hypothetical protein T484DRAFT_1770046 [Cryptophyta sp. CCMP2293]
MDTNLDDVSNMAHKAFSMGKDMFKKGRAVVMNMSEIEAKVRDATGSEPWGPSGTVLHEISTATTDSQQRSIIMQVLYERLKEPAANWKKVYKALNVIDYCVKNGSKRFVEECRDGVDRIESLKRGRGKDDFLPVGGLVG